MKINLEGHGNREKFFRDFDKTIKFRFALALAAVKFFWEDTTLAATAQSRVNTTLKASNRGRRYSPGLARRDPTGDIYWFHSEVSDITAYKDFLSSSADAVEASASGTFNNTDTYPKEVLLGSFATQLGSPNETTPLDGRSWVFRLLNQRILDDVNTLENIKVYWYLRDSEGIQKLLNSGKASSPSAKSFSIITLTSPKIPLTSTDRIVVKVYARFEAGGVVN